MCWCSPDRLFKQCRSCMNRARWRLVWKKKAEDGVHHDSSPSPWIMRNYIIGVFLSFRVLISPDSASRIARELRVQTTDPADLVFAEGDEEREKKRKTIILKKQLRHVTKEDEVAALWGAEGLDASAVALGGNDGRGVRIVDTHAGGGAISRFSVPRLRKEGWEKTWFDVDLKKYKDYKGGARVRYVNGDGVDPYHALWVSNEPTNFIYSPPFCASDLAFARSAQSCAEFSAALMPTTWLRKSVPKHRTDLWNALRSATVSPSFVSSPTTSLS